MEEKNKLLLIFIAVALFSLASNPWSVVCTTTNVYTGFKTLKLDFACTYNYGCTYQASCPSGNPTPSSTGQLGHNELASFFCADDSGVQNPNEYITLSIQGKSCSQGDIILTPKLPQFFTTDDAVEVDVQVAGAGEGYIVHGLIRETGLQRDGFSSFGIATINFGTLPRGEYTLEVTGDNAAAVVTDMEVRGVISLKSSIVPIQPYNFVEANIFLKDENGIGIGIYDLEGLNEGIDIDVYPKNNPFQTFDFSNLQYLGKDDVSGGKFYISGDTQGYVGDVILEATVRKNGYVTANEKFQFSTYIPSLVVEIRCQDFDCPFPNSATLGDTKDFEFYTKKGDDLVDATVSVKVTSPSRLISDQTVPVARKSTGTYAFTYGTFDEVEAWTFTIYAEYPGTDPQTIQPKVSVSKEETQILFSPWLILIVIPIGYLVYRARRK